MREDAAEPLSRSRLHAHPDPAPGDSVVAGKPRVLAVAPTGSGKTLQRFCCPSSSRCARRTTPRAGRARSCPHPRRSSRSFSSHRILRLLCRGVNTIVRRLVFFFCRFFLSRDETTGERALHPWAPPGPGPSRDQAPGTNPGTWERWRSNPPSRAITQPMDARLDPTDPSLFFRLVWGERRRPDRSVDASVRACLRSPPFAMGTRIKIKIKIKTGVASSRKPRR